MCLLAAFSFQILYFCNSKVNEELRIKNEECVLLDASFSFVVYFTVGMTK